MNLSGKVVVITGASTGIGKELAFEFARKGSTVVLGARDIKKLEENAELIKKSGGRALAIQVDVSRRFQVESLIHRTITEYGRLDVLVNNAGISPGKGTILDNTEEQVRATLDVNFMGGLYGVWAAAPHMEKAGGGQIIFVSSIIGKRGIPLNSAYCSSKFAVQGLTESIRPELALKNIHVLNVCPAGVDTPFYEHNDKTARRTFLLHPADKIAKRIVKACEQEKREALLTWDARLLHFLSFLAPGLMDKAIARNKGVRK